MKLIPIHFHSSQRSVITTLIIIFLITYTSISIASHEDPTISNSSNISLGTYSGSGSWSGYDSLCVYSDAIGAQYSIKATTNSGSFSMSNGSYTLPYTASWNDEDSSSFATTLTYNSTLSMQSGSSSPCSEFTNNARFIVSISAVNLLSASAGAYSSTVTLTLYPP